MHLLLCICLWQVAPEHKDFAWWEERQIRTNFELWIQLNILWEILTQILCFLDIWYWFFTKYLNYPLSEFIISGFEFLIELRKMWKISRNIKSLFSCSHNEHNENIAQKSVVIIFRWKCLFRYSSRCHWM